MLHACTRCHEARLLLVAIGDARLCATCWRALGQPSPAAASDVDRYAAEQATWERMLARGGTARHLVRKGIE